MGTTRWAWLAALALGVAACLTPDGAPARAAEGTPAPPPPAKDAVKQTPGFQKLRYVTKVEGKTVKMPYLLYLPVGYDPAKGPYPTLIFLHGAGECGDDWNALFVHGPAMEIQQHPKGKFEATFPFILICPQCPPRGERWDQPAMIKSVVQLLHELEAKVRIDRDRVYVTGLSMGGKGTWHVAMESPDDFAAIAPIAADTVDPRAGTLKNVAVWAIAGGTDGGAAEGSRKMSQMIREAGGRCRLSIVPGVDHGVWPAFYESPTFYEWFLAHRRSDRAARAAAPPWPRAPGFFLREFAGGSGDATLAFHYSIYLPTGYAPLKQGGYPVLLFLHGTGSTGTDSVGVDAAGVCLHGPNGELARKGNEAFRRNFPCIVISPELPPARQWEQPEMEKALTALMDDLAKNLNVDKSRVYLSGLNAGGGGLALAARDPGRFAAVVPVIAAGGLTAPGDLAAALRNTPVYAFVAESDGAATQKVSEIVKQSKADSKLTPITKANEGEVEGLYGNQPLYDWLLKHKQPSKK